MPPLKRRREGDEHECAVPEDPVAAATSQADANAGFDSRDGEFWLEDGSIILVSRRTGFRVYRHLLAAQSLVFHDLVASADPSTGENFEGCPLVHLSDSPEDLRHLLRAILPISNTTFFRETEREGVIMTFDELSAVIRLSHKYAIADLQKQAIRALKSCFKTNFDALEWDVEEDVKGCVDWTDVHAIGAVNLARLTDTLEILPYALYRCTQLHGLVLSGWTHEDGTVEHLDRDDLRRCMDGRGELAWEMNALVSAIFASGYGNQCETTDACRAGHGLVLLGILKGGFGGTVTPDVLRSWSRIIASLPSICEACKEGMHERDRAERRKVWERLPRLFDLEINQCVDGDFH